MGPRHAEYDWQSIEARLLIIIMAIWDQKQAHNYYPTHLWENDHLGYIE